MPSQPLSKQKRFKGALILSAAYSANPGISGFTELAVVRRTSGIGLWSWCDAFPAERMIVLPASATVVDVAMAVLHDDRLAASAVALRDIDVINDRPPLGELLSLAWCNDASAQQRLGVLLALGLPVIERLAGLSDGLCGDAVALMIGRLTESLAEAGVDAEDLGTCDPGAWPDLASAEADLVSRIEAVASELTLRLQQREATLEPVMTQIDAMVARWSRGRHTSRYPGTAARVVLGRGRLIRYVKQHFLDHGALPRGTHQVPAGHDEFGQAGAAFTIDFDALTD